MQCVCCAHCSSVQHVPHSSVQSAEAVSGRNKTQTACTQRSKTAHHLQSPIGKSRTIPHTGREENVWPRSSDVPTSKGGGLDLLLSKGGARSPPSRKASGAHDLRNIEACRASRLPFSRYTTDLAAIRHPMSTGVRRCGPLFRYKSGWKPLSQRQSPHSY